MLKKKGQKLDQMQGFKNNFKPLNNSLKVQDRLMIVEI